MEIFQVLVVVAMIAIAVWQKSREKRVKRMQIRKQQLKEKLDAHLTVVPPPIPVEARTKKKEELRKPIKQASASPLSSQSVGHEDQMSSIRLNTREEARRAFIYSEIFSRKYK